MDIEDQYLGFALILNVIAIALVVTVAKRAVPARRRLRRFGVHPLNRNRVKLGLFNNFYKEVRQHPDRFYDYTRLSIQQFDHLLELLRPSLTKHSIRTPLSPEFRLIITLRFLIGEPISSIKSAYRIGKSTAHAVIDETCEAIWEVLKRTYVRTPTREEYERYASEFYDVWNLPHCVAAIDGKHIQIKSPPCSGSMTINHHGFFSIVLLAACDANYNFILIDVGAVGSRSDGGILRDSKFGGALMNNRLPFPLSCPLPNIPNNHPLYLNVPFFIVGDEAFPLKTNIMRPHSGVATAGNRNRRIFNYRLSRARRVIENAFGILVARWRIFHTMIEANEKNVRNYVKACVALHNFIQQTTEYDHPNNQMFYRPDSEDTETGEIRPGSWRAAAAGHRWNPLTLRNARNATVDASASRDFLTDYLSSPYGSVPWQDNIVDRGVF